MTMYPSPSAWAKRQLHLRHLNWPWALVALVAVLVVAGCTLERNEPTPTPTATPTEGVATPTPTPSTGGGTPALAALPSIAELVERVEPAVVSIQVKVRQRSFYGVVESTSSGSGVIFREDGYILTNNHVVEGAASMRVILFDGSEYDAELVGTDRLTDLAVIRIGEKGLPTAPLGDASKLRVGDWVVAIGNALGMEGPPTVTVGVVSALGRTLTTEDTTLFDLVQTDAAINFGNSGGPLVNLQGEVVGINTAILRGEQAEGIGFAVSTGTAIPVADQLVRNGRVIWPYMGIALADIDRATAAELNLSVREGVLVTRVVVNTPAYSAGIKAQGVITALDGYPTPNLQTLQRLLRTQFKVGQRITITVVRGNDKKEFTLTLAEFPR